MRERRVAPLSLVAGGLVTIGPTSMVRATEAKGRHRTGSGLARRRQTVSVGIGSPALAEYFASRVLAFAAGSQF